MTDSEKLDLLLEKVMGLDGKVTGLEADMIEVKAGISRLHKDDELILDEIERVHEIINKHINDKSKHTA